MRYLSNLLALTIIIFLLFVPFGSRAIVFQQNELSKAIQLFDKRQYAEAEKLFEQLIKTQPDDFMVNYFYGACRTENGHFSDRDLAYLEKASREVSPLDIDYYFGMQYHAKKDWETALFHYNIFSKTAEEAELKRVNLTTKIEQCKNQISPFTWVSASEVLPDSNFTFANTNTINEANILTNDTIILPDSTHQFSDTKQNSIPVNNNTSEVLTNSTETHLTIHEPVPIDPTIDFSVNHEISYKKLSSFRTTEGKQLFEQATNKQKELDAVLKTTNNLRVLYSSTTKKSEKDSLGQRILSLEERSYDLKSEVNELFTKAKLTENEYWTIATEDEKATFISMLNSPKINEISLTSAIQDTGDLEIPDILIDNSAAIKKPSEPVNKDLSYKIQIGAYSRGLPASVKRLFDKLSLIRNIDNYTDDRGVVVYTTGNLTNFTDATTMLKQVQQEGVEDAIIAAYFKGKRIPLAEAKALEGIQ